MANEDDDPRGPANQRLQQHAAGTRIKVGKCDHVKHLKTPDAARRNSVTNRPLEAGSEGRPKTIRLGDRRAPQVT